MIIENPVYGKIKIPDSKEEIQKEIEKTELMLCDDVYSITFGQAYIDVLNEGLDTFRQREETQC
ncbi:MAG TPA: hypothetical protein VN258_06370 [Mobilitalea sp.]|nr:hypothetical protein [Mobilitalea sp.]